MAIEHVESVEAISSHYILSYFIIFHGAVALVLQTLHKPSWPYLNPGLTCQVFKAKAELMQHLRNEEPAAPAGFWIGHTLGLGPLEATASPSAHQLPMFSIAESLFWRVEAQPRSRPGAVYFSSYFWTEGAILHKTTHIHEAERLDWHT